MIQRSRSGRRGGGIVRSQLALRLGLAFYALLCTALALRCMALILSFPPTVSSVSAILAITDLIVKPLHHAPGASRMIIGNATLADLTAAIVLLVAPLPLIGFRTARQP
ncbi:MAG: hypothetical protein U0031_07850 [Thermomicrobiales bacterium]